MRVIVRNAAYKSDALRPVIFGIMEAMGGNDIGREKGFYLCRVLC